MNDDLDAEIAKEIDKIADDIKSILKKIDTLYPRQTDPIVPEEKKDPAEKPNQ